MHELPLKSGDEYDVFTSRRLHAHCERPGYCARVKRRYRKKCRRAAHVACAEVSKMKTEKGKVTLEPLPDYGDLMTLGEFIEAYRMGSFVDYDGIGNYATETQVSNVEVSPSDVVRGDVDVRWTHVVWFNR